MSLILSEILHDSSVSVIAISDHVTQEWGQRWKKNRTLAPSLPNRWFWNFIGWYQMKGCSAPVCQFFRFSVMWSRNDVKARNVLVSTLSNLQLWSSTGWYNTAVPTISVHLIFRFHIMWHRNEVEDQNIQLLLRLYYQIFWFETP